MKVPLNLLIAIICFGILTACTNDSSPIEGQNDRDAGNQNPSADEQNQDAHDSTEEQVDRDTENQSPSIDENNDKDEQPQHKETDQNEEPEIVLENEAFKIFEPAPNSDVTDQIVVRGLARVFEATIQYEFEDGHFMLDKGFTTASEGAPGWGEFEIIIEVDNANDFSGRVFLYEESAKDGSRLHELEIPVHVKRTK